MYVTIFDETMSPEDMGRNTVQTLEQAFALIACRAGLSYAFEPVKEGWKLVLTDVERPDCSPDPVYSTCIKMRDAKYDLLNQACDGRIKGYVALPADDFTKAHILRTANGTRVYEA